MPARITSRHLPARTFRTGGQPLTVDCQHGGEDTGTSKVTGRASAAASLRWYSDHWLSLNKQKEERFFFLNSRNARSAPAQRPGEQTQKWPGTGWDRPQIMRRGHTCGCFPARWGPVSSGVQQVGGTRRNRRPTRALVLGGACRGSVLTAQGDLLSPVSVRTSARHGPPGPPWSDSPVRLQTSKQGIGSSLQAFFPTSSPTYLPATAGYGVSRTVPSGGGVRGRSTVSPLTFLDTMCLSLVNMLP